MLCWYVSWFLSCKSRFLFIRIRLWSFFYQNTRSKKQESYFLKLFFDIFFSFLRLLRRVLRKRNKPPATEAFANERFCNERFCLPEPGRFVFALKHDSPLGYTTQSSPPRDFSGTEGCICRTNSMSPSLSYYHPANCPFCWLPWQHGENSWNQNTASTQNTQLVCLTI